MEIAFLDLITTSGQTLDRNMDNSTYIKPRFLNTDDVIISDKTLEDIKLVFGMVLLLPLSILGILGNVMCLIVLCHHKVKTASNYCLIALSISDMLLLINAALFSLINIYIKTSPREGTNLRNELFPYFGIYTSLVTARITTLLTTLLSTERFVAVHFPMKAKLICNKRTTLFAIIFIYIITIILFLPFPFRYEVVHKITNNVSVISVAKNPNLSEQFSKIYGIAMNFLFRIIPIVLIFVLNIKIMLVIWDQRKQRETLSAPISYSQSREQRKITVMLLVVSFVFLICILPGAINSLLQTFWKDYSRLGKLRNFQQFISYITFFLEAGNSAVNFIIYMALSARFYAVYREVFYSAKNIIRRVSFGSFSRDKSTNAFRNKCESRSSFTNSEGTFNKRLSNRQLRNDSSKSLLARTGYADSAQRINSNKSFRETDGILHELSENSSKSVGYCCDRSDENGYIQMKPLGNESDHETLRLVKQDTLETSDGFVTV